MAEKGSTPQTFAGFEGRSGGAVHVYSAKDGASVNKTKLAAPPIWDGMAVAQGRLYVSRTDGVVMCLGKSAGDR